MADARHTPGPWRNRGIDAGVTIIPDKGDPLAAPLAIVCWIGADGEPSANARLIAKAPELLTIAQRLIQWDRDYPVASFTNAGLKELDAIIADGKATVAQATGGLVDL